MLRILLLLPLGSILASGVFIALAQLGLPKQTQLSPPDLAPLQLFKLSQASEPQLRQRPLPVAPQLTEAVPTNHPQSPSHPATTQTSPLALTSINDLSLPKLDSSEFSQGLSLVSTLVAAPQPATSSSPLLDLTIHPQYRHPPDYPLAARRRNIEGSVTLEFTVTANGQVLASSIRVVKAEPSGIFEQAAKRSLSQWRFPEAPPLGFKSRQKIEFKLTNVQ